MANQHQIKRLEEVLQPYLPDNQRIVSYDTKCLTQPGDNYGSLLLVVDVMLEADGKEREVLHLVAKMCPPNEWIKKMFNIPVTFKKEIGIYKTISNTLEQFQLEYGVGNHSNAFPRYFGSRISLDPQSDVVDDDAVLLLENLKVQGYTIGNRFEGFDLETSERIIKDLANLHSVVLAMKIKKPEVFEEKIYPVLKPMKGFSDISEEIKDGMKDGLVKIMEKEGELVPHLEKVRNYLCLGEKIFEQGTLVREPFATIGHGDFWVNNMMIKRENGDIKVKMLDFQIVDYGSPARDLIFFLYTSVQRRIIDEHSSRFIKLYFKTFIETLELFKCDTNAFTFEAFTEELKHEAKNSQLFHCLVMLSPIHAVNTAMKDVKDLEPADMLSSDRSEEYEPKVIHTVLSFLRNKWL